MALRRGRFGTACWGEPSESSARARFADVCGDHSRCKPHQPRITLADTPGGAWLRQRGAKKPAVPCKKNTVAPIQKNAGARLWLGSCKAGGSHNRSRARIFGPLAALTKMVIQKWHESSFAQQQLNPVPAAANESHGDFWFPGAWRQGAHRPRKDTPGHAAGNRTAEARGNRSKVGLQRPPPRGVRMHGLVPHVHTLRIVHTIGRSGLQVWGSSPKSNQELPQPQPPPPQQQPPQRRDTSRGRRRAKGAPAALHTVHSSINNKGWFWHIYIYAYGGLGMHIYMHIYICAYIYMHYIYAYIYASPNPQPQGLQRPVSQVAASRRFQHEGGAEAQIDQEPAP